MLYLFPMALIAIGLYAIIFKRNLIKKMIGFSIFSNGVHLFFMLIGYKAGGIPPILAPGGAGSYLMVDPLPQALVLTSIVINVSVLAVALSIIIMLYRQYGTLDTSEIRELKG